MRLLFFLILPAILVFGYSLTYDQEPPAMKQEYPDDCLDSLVIPNTHTPNGDGINEAWMIYFPCPPDSFNVMIFNRWGEVVFESNDHKFQWDGTLPNGQMKDDVYVYRLRYSFKGRREDIKGHVTILL